MAAVYQTTTGCRIDLDPHASRFWAKVGASTARGCREWRASTQPSGYGQFAVKRDGVQNVLLAHRVAWLLARGPIPIGQWVLHRCDNRRCCAPEHMFLGSAADNTADMMAKGRGMTGRHHLNRKSHPPRDPATVLRGGRVASARLTWDSVAAIRSRTGESQRALAREFGVTQSTIGKVLRGDSWVRQ